MWYPRQDISEIEIKVKRNIVISKPIEFSCSSFFGWFWSRDFSMNISTPQNERCWLCRVSTSLREICKRLWSLKVQKTKKITVLLHGENHNQNHVSLSNSCVVDLFNPTELWSMALSFSEMRFGLVFDFMDCVGVGSIWLSYCLKNYHWFSHLLHCWCGYSK